jgi:hypothetical protein
MGGRGPEATLRDALALRWIAEQYLVRADVAAVVLARLSPVEELPIPGRLGGRTLRHHAERWERLGFCERRRLRGASWLLPTRRGVAYAGLELPAYEPNGSTLEHTHAVAVVRLAVEEARPDAEWTSERRLRAERARGERGWWLPDGLVEVDGLVSTVEVELSRKKLVALRQAATAVQHPRARSRVYCCPSSRVDSLRSHLATLEAEVSTARRGAPWLATQVRPLPVVEGVAYGMPDSPVVYRARCAG